METHEKWYSFSIYFDDFDSRAIHCGEKITRPPCRDSKIRFDTMPNAVEEPEKSPEESPATATQE